VHCRLGFPHQLESTGFSLVFFPHFLPWIFGNKWYSHCHMGDSTTHMTMWVHYSEHWHIQGKLHMLLGSSELHCPRPWRKGVASCLRPVQRNKHLGFEIQLYTSGGINCWLTTYHFVAHSGMTAIATYLLTKEIWNSGAGLFAACFIAVGQLILSATRL